MNNKYQSIAITTQIERTLKSLNTFARVPQKVTVGDATTVFARCWVARGQCRLARVSGVPKWARTFVVTDFISAHATVEAGIRSALVRFPLTVDT